MDKGLHMCQISFIYKGSKITTLISQTKPLSVLKEKAHQLFFPIKGRIIFNYLGKELSQNENKQIGLVFSNKPHITLAIQVKAIPNQRTPNSLLKIKYDKPEMNYSSDMTSRSLLSLSRTRRCSYKSLLSSKRSIISLRNHQGVFCFECCEKEVQFYCRQCNAFLCNVCKFLSQYEHCGHTIIEIETKDLMMSADQNKEAIVSDLNKAKDDYSNVKETVLEKVDTSNWTKKLKDKVNRFYSLSQELNAFTHKEDNHKTSSRAFNSMQFDKEHESLREILNTIGCSNRNDLCVLFQMIYSAEKEINKLIFDTGKREQYTLIQKSIISYYKAIEEEIDSLILQTKRDV